MILLDTSTRRNARKATKDILCIQVEIELIEIYEMKDPGMHYGSKVQVSLDSSLASSTYRETFRSFLYLQSHCCRIYSRKMDTS